MILYGQSMLCGYLWTWSLASKAAKAAASTINPYPFCKISEPEFDVQLPDGGDFFGGGKIYIYVYKYILGQKINLSDRK